MRVQGTIAWNVLVLFALSIRWTLPIQADEPSKYALLIGVSKYSHSAMNQPEPLLYPEDDAQAIAQLLQENGYEVDLLLGSQASAKDIRKKLEGLRQQGNSDGIVLIGLFGHGVEIESIDAAGEVSREGCFCPHDTAIQVVKDSRGNEVFDNNRQPLTEPDPASLVKMSELMTALKLSPAGNRVVLADCCRTSPNRARGRSFGTAFRSQDLPTNTSILFGCAPNEQAFEHSDWGHGAFTKCLLDEIRDLSLQGSVETAQLAARLKRKVPQLVSSVSPRSIQTPKLFATDSVDLQLKSEDPDYLRGVNLFYGFGTPIDHVSAVHHFKLAADRGHALAAASITLLTFHGGCGTKADPKQAKKLGKACIAPLIDLANNGNSEAQNLLSGFYKHGLGTAKDLEEGFRMLELSAKQGYGPAMTNLGVEYHLGDGAVAQDFEEARRWYVRAAESGLAEAQFALGVLYRQESSLKNEAESRRWIERAALQGEPNSFSEMGSLLQEGIGGPKNLAEAARWFRKGVDQDDSRAQMALGLMLYDGSLPKNYAESFSLIKRSAEQGVLSAQLLVAVFYGTGVGTARDSSEAIKWYRAVLQHPDLDDETQKIARQSLQKLGVMP